MAYKLFTDGSHLMEFKVAGFGGYLLKDNETVFEFSEIIENPAFHTKHETLTLTAALTQCLKENLQNEPIELFSDAQDLMLILNKANKDNRNSYAEKNPLLTEVFSLCDQFTNISFNYIPRNENSKADKLSRKAIIDTLFKDHQLKDGSFSHPKLISKNNYPKDNTVDFSIDKKDITNFLVVHSFRNMEKRLREVNIFYAEKNESGIVFELQEAVYGEGKKWDNICIELVDKHLKILSHNNPVIGLVLHDEFITLDQLLRGRTEMSVKNKPFFDSLSTTLDGLEKVFVHRDALAYESIFNDDPSHMNSKHKLNNMI
jgi:ribonuclease HI